MTRTDTNGRELAPGHDYIVTFPNGATRKFSCGLRGWRAGTAPIPRVMLEFQNGWRMPDHPSLDGATFELMDPAEWIESWMDGNWRRRSVVRKEFDNATFERLGTK